MTVEDDAKWTREEVMTQARFLRLEEQPHSDSDKIQVL